MDAQQRGGENRPAAPNSPYDAHHLPGRAAAMADVERFYLAPHIERLVDPHPLKTFVYFLALYARDVLTGELPNDPWHQ